MDYLNGIQYMKKLCQLGSSSFNVPNTNITIQYPGYKRNGDYKLLLNGNPPTHVDICCTLHNYIMQNPNEYTKISRLLEDVYQNGTNCIGNYNLQNYNADYLINLIFWMTLQDEINYPQPRKSGRKMPFCRYFEAIYCANFQANFSINNVIVRCNNRGYIPNLYNNLINLVNFYN